MIEAPRAVSSANLSTVMDSWLVAGGKAVGVLTVEQWGENICRSVRWGNRNTN